MRFLVDELNAYKYDSVDNCLRMTGKRPIPVKWVDVNKGDAQRPEVRVTLDSCRDQAQDNSFRGRQCANVLNFTVRSTATTCVKSHVLMFIDITRAHPHSTMRRQVWVELLAEDPRRGTHA